MDRMTVTIPYKPRYKDVHKALEKKRFSVIVAHRRFGKTVLAINHLIKKALLCSLDGGRFAYIAPLLKTAKEAAWDYLKKYTSTIPGRKVNESDLSIIIPSKGGSARLRVFGADNPDALRGSYLDGVILDEVAQMKPEVWHEVAQPMLADRKGWALFIGTPKGINLFSEQYYRALEEAEKGGDWAAFSFPVTQTTALPPDEVARLQNELSPNAWRQEMLCDFSASSDDILIPLPLAQEAASRVLRETDYSFSPVVLGVDVARYGNDRSVIFPRQGLVAHIPVVLKGVDNMGLASRVAYEARERNAQAIFVDAGGGAGVIDRLRQLGHVVHEVHFGSSAARPDRYFNRRCEMWVLMAEWLKSGACIPPDQALIAELSAPSYHFDERGLMRLEGKDQICERLRRSPDLADALALTFAMPIAARDCHMTQENQEYDPFAW